MRDLVVSLGRSDNLAAVTKVAKTSWSRFAEFLTREPPVTADKASVGWYCGAEFSPAYRDSENFVARHLLTFDYDRIDEFDVEDIKVAYSSYAHVLYTTASHTPEKPRIRVVFPLSRPATMDEFCAVTRKFATRFNLEKLARESDTPAQMMFLPSKRPDGIFWSTINPGAWVDVDALLGEYDDWQNRSEWPRRLTGDSTHSSGEGLEPPDQKAGIVGDFCRAFRIPEAIERFELPYVSGSQEDRYTLTSGSRADGARLYDDGLKLHSEHDTDPARGQNNAFDLVRLHKFGKLDSAEDLARPVTERPSFKAMVGLALEQPEIEQARLTGEFEDLDETEGPLAQSALIETTSTDAKSALAVPLTDLLTHPTKPRWLLRDKLEHGVIGLLTGPRGSYKSFIALDWLMCAAKDHGPVYVVSGEGADFDRRAKAWLQTFAPEWDHTGRVFVVQRRIDLNQHDNIQLIRDDCAKFGIRPVLFVLDTFSKLSGALDENSNTDVKAFIGRLDNGLKRAYDATVLIVTHTGHGEKTRARGASALEADTDAAYIVSRHPIADRTVLISRERFKASPELEPLVLAPEVVPLGYTDDDGEMVTSLILRPTNAPRDHTGPEPKGLYGKNALDAARELLRSTGAPVDMEKLVSAAVDKLPAPDGAIRDTRRQQTTRAIQKLVADNLLYLHVGNMISLTRAKIVDEGEWE